MATVGTGRRRWWAAEQDSGDLIRPGLLQTVSDRRPGLAGVEPAWVVDAVVAAKAAVGVVRRLRRWVTSVAAKAVRLARHCVGHRVAGLKSAVRVHRTDSDNLGRLARGDVGVDGAGRLVGQFDTAHQIGVEARSAKRGERFARNVTVCHQAEPESDLIGSALDGVELVGAVDVLVSVAPVNAESLVTTTSPTGMLLVFQGKPKPPSFGTWKVALPANASTVIEAGTMRARRAAAIRIAGLGQRRSQCSDRRRQPIAQPSRCDSVAGKLSTFSENSAQHYELVRGEGREAKTYAGQQRGDGSSLWGAESDYGADLSRSVGAGGALMGCRVAGGRPSHRVADNDDLFPGSREQQSIAVPSAGPSADRRTHRAAY